LQHCTSQQEYNQWLQEFEYFTSQCGQSHSDWVIYEVPHVSQWEVHTTHSHEQEHHQSAGHVVVGQAHGHEEHHHSAGEVSVGHAHGQSSGHMFHQMLHEAAHPTTVTSTPVDNGIICFTKDSKVAQELVHEGEHGDSIDDAYFQEQLSEWDNRLSHAHSHEEYEHLSQAYSGFVSEYKSTHPGCPCQAHAFPAYSGATEVVSHPEPHFIVGNAHPEYEIIPSHGGHGFEYVPEMH
jgi:hypothetical protein